MPVDAGRGIAPWSGRRKVEATARVRAEGRRFGAPCVICGQEIDYSLDPRDQDPQSCSVQHVLSRSTHPHLTWDPSNWAPAHLLCNKAAGTARPDDLGLTSGW
jgi:5-methylcytosine-specific restriction endonuclease McrA